MNIKPYVIEIDAQAAFAKLGVDLRISPISESCVAALKKHLNGCITLDLLYTSLGEATGASKPRRVSKKSGMNLNQGGGHEI